MPATAPLPPQYDYLANVLTAADKVNASALTAAQANIVAAFNSLLADLGFVVRSDNQLMDQIVHLWTLGQDVLGVMGSAAGWQPKTSAQASTTAALPANTYAAGVLTATANGALPVQDGITLTAGQSLLVQNEVASQNNGIYTVTQVGSGSLPYILTRRSDSNTGALLGYAFLYVQSGAINGGINFLCVVSAGILVLGTTPIAFMPFGKAQGPSAVLGLSAGGTGGTSAATARAGIGLSAAMDPILQASSIPAAVALLMPLGDITGKSIAISQTDASASAVSAIASAAAYAGAVALIQATGAAFAGIVLHANITDAHSNGVAISVDVSTTDGAMPQHLRMKYGGNQIFAIQPLRPDDAGVYQFQYDAQFFPTINSANSPIIHHTNANINIPASLNITGEYLGHHLQVCRSHDNATDSGTLASLKAFHITVGHDNLPGANPNTTSVTAVNLRLRRNNGTIGNMFAINFELKEAGATITGNMYGLYDNSDVVYGVGQGLKHCLSGRTTFGSTGVPAESVDVQAGNLKLLGTTGNTLKIATASPNAAVACVFTANVGPTGARTNIQTWARINVQGTDYFVPCF